MTLGVKVKQCVQHSSWQSSGLNLEYRMSSSRDLYSEFERGGRVFDLKFQKENGGKVETTRRGKIFICEPQPLWILGSRVRSLVVVVRVE